MWSWGQRLGGVAVSQGPLEPRAEEAGRALPCSLWGSQPSHTSILGFQPPG